MYRIALSLMILLFPMLTASGYTVSGNISGREGAALTYVYTIPTSLDTFCIAIANFLNGTYSQGNLDEASYIIFFF